MKRSPINLESPNIEFRVLADMDELAHCGAEMFCQAATHAVNRRGRFAVAVSGGSTPRAMHRLLASTPFAETVPWESTHLFWIDERMVAYDDPASNYGAAYADLIRLVPIPTQNVHPMPVGLLPELGVAAYQSILQTFFAQRPVFDLIFLGIGTDGHVASLFPEKRRHVAPDRWVLADQGGRPNVWRLSLTDTVLNQAEQVVFLVSGSSKAPIVRRIFEETGRKLPAQQIRPRSGRLTWLLDKAAVSLLTKPLANLVHRD